MSRMGPQGKDAFGKGLGLAHQVGLALGEQGISPQTLNRIVTDPIVAAGVAAALRSEKRGEIDIADLIKREISLVGEICRLTGVDYPGDAVIENALRKAEKQWGGLCEHDRFVPAGLNRRKPIEVCSGRGLKIYNDSPASANCDDEELPTEVGIIRLDFQKVMRPTDIEGRPFNLNHEEQVVWAKQQGGDGLTSAEENLYFFLRCLMETGLPLWGGGSIRCRNSFGSESSLFVLWHAGSGLYVDSWYRGYRDWALGALPRKFLEIGN